MVRDGDDYIGNLNKRAAGSAVRVIQGDCGAPSLIEILMRAAGDLFRILVFGILFTLFHRQFQQLVERAAL